MSDNKQKAILGELTAAYWMEMETVMSYVCNSVNVDGVRAQEVKRTLATDVQKELGHAQTLARRIREPSGIVPGSLAVSATQQLLQPPAEATDVLSVIKSMINAKEAAMSIQQDYQALRRRGLRNARPMHLASCRRRDALSGVQRLPGRVRALTLSHQKHSKGPSRLRGSSLCQS